MNTLETPRLLLRPMVAGDAESIFRNWASDPEVTRYLTWPPHTDISTTRAVLNHWLAEADNPHTFRFGIQRKAGGVLMGMIDVTDFRDGIPHIGYVLGKAFWGQGYMTEAMGACIPALFARGYEAIGIEAMEENIASNRVIQKCGFTFVQSALQPQSALKPEIVAVNSYILRRK